MNEDLIRENSTPQSLSRGRSYFQQGAVSGTVKRGADLEGQVQGSGYSPYRIHVVLTDDQQDVLSATCTCPYDWGGFCKHIVALLLAYVHRPEMFTEQPSVQDTLAERSKEQLIDLIRQMLLRYPDLQSLVDRPQPGSSAGGKVDTESFRRELRQSLADMYGEWGDSTPESTIQSVAASAKRFASAGDWRNASAIYGAIIDECLNGNDDYWGDDEGYFAEAITDVLAALANCLAHPEIADDEKERRAILNYLIDAYIWDVDQGGIGLTDGVMPDALIKHTQQSDIAPIRKRIQEAQRHKAGDTYGRWGAAAYENLLMDLDLLDNVDPEVTLQRLRDQEMYRLLFDKLLQLQRIDEAVAVVAEHLTAPYERLQVLPLLIAAGQADAALRLGQETLKTQFDLRLAEGLAAQYETRQNGPALFDLRLKLMREAPSEAAYKSLKKAAEMVGTWQTVRPTILQRLEKDKKYDVLTRIYLSDQDWDAAWQAVEMTERIGKQSWLGLPPLILEVAERSRQDRPRRAIPVYIDQARRAINERNRSSYARAAEYLSVVRDLYNDLDEDESWENLIEQIRDEFKRLRALQDELNQAGL